MQNSLHAVRVECIYLRNNCTVVYLLATGRVWSVDCMNTPYAVSVVSIYERYRRPGGFLFFFIGGADCIVSR
jgi:hypothetical protein